MRICLGMLNSEFAEFVFGLGTVSEKTRICNFRMVRIVLCYSSIRYELQLLRIVNCDFGLEILT